MSDLTAISVSHAQVGRDRYQFTTTKHGVIARKMGQGEYRFHRDTNLIAIKTESGIAWRREAKLQPSHEIHLFATQGEAERFALR